MQKRRLEECGDHKRVFPGNMNSGAPLGYSCSSTHVLQHIQKENYEQLIMYSAIQHLMGPPPRSSGYCH